MGRGRAENKVAGKKTTEIRAEKGQRKKVKLGWQRDRKENPITAPAIHSSIHSSIHPRWCSGGRCFTLAPTRYHMNPKRKGKKKKKGEREGGWVFR
jgi:hypothetical protein